MAHDAGPGPETKTALVGIFSLQVLLCPEGDSWIAQALELDYAAAGDTLEDAKRRFESGLRATLHEHFKLFGDLDHFLERRPPVEDVLGLLKQKVQSQYYSQVSVHQFAPPEEFGEVVFPFGKIEYFGPSFVAA